MTNRFDTMLRWWKTGPGHWHDPANGKTNGNGNEHGTDLFPGEIPPNACRLPGDSDESSDAAWCRPRDLAGIPRTLTYPSTTLGRMLDQTADRFANSTALI